MSFSHKDIQDEIRRRPGIKYRNTHRIIKRYITRLEIEDGAPLRCIKERIAYEWEFKFRPDAFFIDRADKRIHFYEVEDFHRVDNYRLAHYWEFFDWLGEFGISGTLHIFNRFGIETILTICDLLIPWYEELERARRKSGRV